jgi:hypothetical protein
MTGESGSALLVPQIAADMSQLDAALAHASAGIHVFPADHPELPQCAGIKTAEHDPTTCDKRGKHPVVKWDTGASTNLHNIHHWWAGLIDEDAPDEFARFAADLGVTPPDTYTVTTANGKHYYFQHTEGGALGNKEGAFRDYHINVRSGSGYVIAAGSVHETASPMPPTECAPSPLYPRGYAKPSKARGAPTGPIRSLILRVPRRVSSSPRSSRRVTGMRCCTASRAR